MRNLGGILVLLLFIIALSSSFGAVYYFTELETRQSELQDHKAEVKELQRRLEEEKQKGRAANAPRPVPVEARISASGTMMIGQPADGQTVTSPVTVAGMAIAFESTVNIRVRDGEGNILSEVAGMTDAPDAGQLGEFSVDVSFGVPATESGTIEVFEYSARDGSEINKAGVPVVFTVE